MNFALARLAFQAFKWLLGVARIKPPDCKNVLIVEDCETDAELMELVIMKQGFIPFISRNLNEAIMALSRRRYHRIYLDMNLGKPIKDSRGNLVMEGTIFAELAVKELGNNARIIVVTGSAAALEDSKSTRKFPCIIKGSKHEELASAIISGLLNGDQSVELKLWKLFCFVIFIAVASGAAATAALWHYLKANHQLVP